MRNRKQTTKWTDFDRLDGGYSAANHCFGGSPDPAPAPDYAGAAQATAAGNLDAAKYQTEANRINQYTPFGSLTYDRGTKVDQARYDADMAAYQASISQMYGTHEVSDRDENGNYTTTTVPNYGGWYGGGAPEMPKAPDIKDYTTENWSQTTTLDPKLQAALNSQLDIQQGRSSQALSMLDTVKNSYATPFQAPELQKYLANVGAVNANNVGQAGTFTSTGTDLDTNFQSTAPALNTNYGTFASTTPKLNTDINTLNTTGVNAVNQNAPQFDANNAELYARKAYEAQMALMRPGLDEQQTKLQNGLALQGLNAGTEANNNAQSAFSMARAAQENALAASSYLSGAQVNQGNYASQLAGFNAGNAAQNQAYGQTANTFGLNQSALAQANAARATGFQQDLSAFDANMDAKTAENTARSAQLAQQLGIWQANNAAKNTQFTQNLGAYGANLQGLTTNSQLNAAQNAAQAQAYGQQVNNYGMDYQAALSQRNMPLNELNALMTGQQVQSPTFNNYALQGQTAGADLSGAAQAQGQWDQGIFNQQAAQSAGTTSAVAGLAGTAAMAFAMY
jgi:hypothetical protein